ncbi:hypothetical protein LTS18_014549, partial [Coniosporium uncinatum]
MLLASQKQLARIMYEKNFIAILTSSIADIDLNFPGAKRAVKYILRPLKLLTQTAFDLSVSSDLSTTPGATDEDEISTASSVSDMDDTREETPDLFRNSALGILDSSGQHESDEGSEEEDEDEEMYDDGYGDEVGYDDEMERDDDEVVSEEDEEMGPIEGMPGDGLDVEIVVDGDEADGMSGDSDDDADEDSEDDDDDLDDDDIEIMEEVTGDDENGSLPGADDEDWGTEDEDNEDIEDEDGPYDINPVTGSPHPRGTFGDVVHIISDEDPIGGMLRRIDDAEQAGDMEAEGFLEDDGHENEDEDEEEYGEEDEEVVYEPEFEGEHFSDAVSAPHFAVPGVVTFDFRSVPRLEHQFVQGIEQEDAMRQEADSALQAARRFRAMP